MLKNKNRKLITKLISYNFKCNINGKINFRYGHLLPSLFLSFTENVFLHINQAASIKGQSGRFSCPQEILARTF